MVPDVDVFLPAILMEEVACGIHRVHRAQFGGARLIGCTMTMDLLGIAESDLIDNIELGGVATFLGEAAESTTTLFI